MAPDPELQNDSVYSYLRRMLSHLMNRINWERRSRPFKDLFELFGSPDEWWISNFLYYLFRLLLQVWTTVLLLTILALLLTRLDQAYDFFDDFGNKSLAVRMLSYTSVFCCSFVTWFGTRLQFILFDILDTFKRKEGPGVVEVVQSSSENKRTEKKWTFDSRFFKEVEGKQAVASPLIRYTPVVLGMLPLLILIAGFAHAGNGSAVSMAVVLMLVFWSIVAPIRNYVKDGDDSFDDDSDKVTAPHSFSSLHVRFRFLTYFIWVVCGVFFVVTPFFETTLWISRQAGIISITFGAFTIWIWMLVFINMLNSYFKPAVHLFLIIVFFAVFVYPNNNNHEIRVIDDVIDDGYVSKKLGDSLGIDPYFHKWLAERSKVEKKNGGDTVHAYVVAAEGGGIRAAYWTAGVLAQLERYVSLTDNIFAISGVSGGSVGAGFYVSLYRDFFNYRTDMKYQFADVTRQFMQKDFLSPLVTAGLGPDMFQKFLFFKIPSFDRARYLEDSWAYDYQEAVNLAAGKLSPEKQIVLNPKGIDTFNRSFDSIWDLKNGSPKRYIPILFLNCTHVDLGRKAVVTPLSIAGNPYFADVIDIMEQVHREVPLKTAVSMSARFPGFTPPATVNDPRNTSVPIAHYVDGGYVDNSGLETALGILSTLMATHDNRGKSGSCATCADSLARAAHRHPVVKIHVIFIKNSSQDMERSGQGERNSPVHSLYEATDPARTFFNAWDNSLLPRIALAREFLRNASVRSQGQMVEVDSSLYILELDRDSGRMPLGWQLSASAAARISRQIRLLPKQIDFQQLRKNATASASFSPAPSAIPH